MVSRTSAGQADDHEVKSGRGAIAQLLAQYALGVDGRQFDLLSGCFAEHSVMSIEPRSGDPAIFQGRDRIVEFLRTFQEDNDAQRRHFMTNLIVQARPGDPDRMDVSSYLLLTVVENGELVVKGTGHYVDVVVRTSGADWQFENRRIALDLEF